MHVNVIFTVFLNKKPSCFVLHIQMHLNVIVYRFALYSMNMYLPTLFSLCSELKVMLKTAQMTLFFTL